MVRETVKQVQGVRLAIFAVCALIGGAFVSCHELKYSIWGRTADAQIFDKRLDKIRNRGEEYQVYYIRYRWTDADDGERQDKRQMPRGWYPPADGVIKIDYLPGVMDSRMAGHRNWGGLIIFAIVGGGLLITFAALWIKGSSGKNRARR